MSAPYVTGDDVSVPLTVEFKEETLPLRIEEIDVFITQGSFFNISPKGIGFSKRDTCHALPQDEQSCLVKAIANQFLTGLEKL
jgi:hypothetical protein